MRVDRITLMVKKQQHMCRTFQSHLPQCRGDKYLFCTTPGYCGILEMPAEDHPQQLDVSLKLWSFLKEKKVSLAFIQVKIHCCDCLKNSLWACLSWTSAQCLHMKAEVYGGKASLSTVHGMEGLWLALSIGKTWITLQWMGVAVKKKRQERKVERDRLKGISIGMSGQDILQSTLEP